MDWLSTNTAVVVAILGPTFLAIGYFYKARSEKKENLREALYLLLEIWHRMMLLRANGDRVFEVGFRVFANQFPKQKFDPLEVEMVKQTLRPLLERVMHAIAMKDVDGLHDAYMKCVRLISKSDPVYAYRLESAVGTKEVLSAVDDLFSQAFQPVVSLGNVPPILIEGLRKRFDAFAKEDVLQDIESNLRGLARRLGVHTLVSVHFVIRRRRKRMSNMPEKEIEDAFRNIVLADLSQQTELLNTVLTQTLGAGASVPQEPVERGDSQPRASAN